MPKQLIGVADYSAQVSIPTAGDARTALSVEAPFQVLTNKIEYLHQHFMPLSLQQPLSSMSGAVFNGASLTPNAVGTVLYLPLYGLVHEAELVSVSMRLNGGNSSPSTPAQLELFTADASGLTSLGLQADTSPGSPGRQLTLSSGSPWTIDLSSYRYLLRYTAESDGAVASIVELHLTLQRPS